jgi:hypothetical protein
VGGRLSRFVKLARAVQCLELIDLFQEGLQSSNSLEWF